MATGVSPWLAIPVAVTAGFVAGCCTAFIHLRFRIHTLLAGILMITILYSINLRIMGKSNILVLNMSSIFDTPLPTGPHLTKILVVSFAASIVSILLTGFFRTEKGTSVRAVGANPDLARALEINDWTATIAGVGLANAFSALSGAIMVQSQGFADVNMDLGILINGLAALMIGEAITGKHTVLRQVLAPFVGAIVYYQLISVCLAAGMPPADLTLTTGFLVLIMLAAPSLKRNGSPPTSSGQDSRIS